LITIKSFYYCTLNESLTLQAERDSLAVFGAVPAYASELVVWARDVTEFYAEQIKQHVLSSAAAAGGLQAAAECVQIAFGHCSLLEAQGLTMCPLLAKVFRSSVEQAMEANLKRIEESVTALASADDWTLPCYQQTSLFNSRRSLSLAFGKTLGRASVMLSSSAYRFSSMAQVDSIHPPFLASFIHHHMLSFLRGQHWQLRMYACQQLSDYKI
jgi:hypothetical protein